MGRSVLQCRSKKIWGTVGCSSFGGILGSLDRDLWQVAKNSSTRGCGGLIFNFADFFFHAALLNISLAYGIVGESCDSKTCEV